jgi:hypothetical protein
MPILTSSAKARGRKLQMYIRDFIREKTNMGDGDVESRSMGAGGVDILLSPAARKYTPFSIECKNTKSRPNRTDIEQSRSNKYPNTLPVVIWKPSQSRYKECQVICYWEELYEFVYKLIEEIDASKKED